MRALVVNQDEGKNVSSIEAIPTSLQHDEEEVTVAINWSSLNYKDALAITGKGKIIRQFPMIPGIDFAGTVIKSRHNAFHPNQTVVLTGWGVGENYPGGLAEQITVPAKWLLPLPEQLTTRKAMIIGTAGFTAMLCVMALEEKNITPEQGDILVTGASGGVGSVAVALLNALGFNVIAVTGRPANHDYLKQLGATTIIERESLLASCRPLEKQRWAGAIDTVGGTMLANILTQINYGGTVAACGLAGGVTLPTTVMPFILRNVCLQGVDSVSTPNAIRSVAWQRLAQLLPETFYQLATTEINLEQAAKTAEALLENKITGRIIVKIN